MSAPVVAILNLKSGSSGDEFRAQIEAALTARNLDFQIVETDPQRGAVPAVQAALKSGATQILACGGDGTIMSAVNGLAQIEREPKTRFSIVPGGTANLLAQALGIPHNVEGAIEIAVSGRERLIDLGECGDTVFALGLGLGLTEKLVSGTSSREKETLGRLAYVKAMLAELGQKPQRFSYRLDDKAEQSTVGVALVVANAGEISGHLKFAPNARMDDGLLDLCVLHRFYIRDLLRFLVRGLWGNLPDDRAISFFQAKKISLRTDPPLDLQIDGEPVEIKPPLTVTVRPRALKVTVAEEKSKSEG